MDIEKIIDEVMKELQKCLVLTAPEVLVLADEVLTCDLGFDYRSEATVEEVINELKTIVLLDVSCDKLYKLASGCDDTPYLKLAVAALLAGKEIIIPKDAIAYFQYKDTAPKLYYQKMQEHLSFVTSCGVKVVEDVAAYLGGAKSVVVEETVQSVVDRPIAVATCEGVEEKPQVFKVDKKLVTDRDVKEALRSGAKVIEVSAKTIVTQLAKDSMNAYKIRLVEH